MVRWKVGGTLGKGCLQGAVAMVVILVVHETFQVGSHLDAFHPHPQQAPQGSYQADADFVAEMNRLRKENRMLKDKLEVLAKAAGLDKPKPKDALQKEPAQKEKPTPALEAPKPGEEPLPVADSNEELKRLADEKVEEKEEETDGDTLLPQVASGAPAKQAIDAPPNLTCSAQVSAFEPGDEKSRKFLKSAGWELSKISAGPFKGFSDQGPLQLRFRDRGTAKVGVTLPLGVSVSLNGFEIIKGRSTSDSCAFYLVYVPGDILEISAAGGAAAAEAFKLDSLQLIVHGVCPAVRPSLLVPASGANASVPGVCRAWERVRLPWSDCIGADDAKAAKASTKTRWIEGRVAKVLNSTHAIVSVPSPPKPGAPAFDPTSKFTSYQDDGNCGPRGDDAEEDTSSCPKGAEVIAAQPMDNYNKVAVINGCGYFAYKIFRCKGADASVVLRPEDTRLVLPASLLRPAIDDAPEAISLAGAAALPHCNGFQDEGKGIVIMVLGDKKFQAKYKGQIQSLQCFTDANDYKFVILEGNEYRTCDQYGDYFFRKHCTVAEWMEDQSPNLQVAIVDADVVAVVLERGLEKWANHDADVQVYQRCLFPEIMAGNYMVRNTPFARKFLRNWAKYNHKKPKGFSSSDNGAIHLVVQETVKATGFKKCKKMYNALKSTVNDLTEYFEYVTCVTDHLGPPRDWNASGGVVTVWPRLNFWATDGVYMVKAASVEIGPVIHHGMKDPKHVTEHYYKNVTSCERNYDLALQPADALGKHALGVARGYKEYFPQGKNCKGTALHQCPERCMTRFACWPLKNREPPLPNQTCTTDCS